MKTLRLPLLCWTLLLLAPALLPGRAYADEAGYKAAAYQLRQTTQFYRDGRHNVMLRGLRQLEDKKLQPLFATLSNSKFAQQRVHGMLGLGEISPQRRIDLAALAEIEDTREVVEILSVAMDNDLVDNAGLATVMRWESLSLPVKQAVALRLLGDGGSVEPAQFTESLDVELNEDLAIGKMMQYALGGLVLAETGHASGASALSAIGKVNGQNADTVLAQVLDGAMRRELKSVRPLALTVAKDKKRNATLRLLAIQVALRLKAEGATATWQSMYQDEESPARRIRLAIIAMDAAKDVPASLFDTLASSDDELVRLIGQAGRAIASNSDNAADAFAPLLASGQPLITQWLPVFCLREEPKQGPALLEQVIRSHNKGEERNRGRMAEAAISATTVMCERYPEQAAKRLPALLDAAAGADASDNTEALQLRQIILLGISRARGADLGPLTRLIATDKHNDFTTEALRLLVRARYDAPLTDVEWTRVSDLIQGVGQMDLGLRVQLAWLYLKHTGQADKAIAEAVK